MVIPVPSVEGTLRRLAMEYGVRSPQKLLQLARKIGAPAMLEESKAALSTNVAAQTLGPPPRSLGKSAATGPGKQLQADLMDFNQMGYNQEHKYALQVADVFTRKAYTEPLKSKSATDVAIAMKGILKQIPQNGANAVLTTDKGREFSDFDRVLPASAVLKHKQTINDISVVDRQMQSLKKGLEDRAQNFGEPWAGALKKVTYNYNETPHETVHGAPNTAAEEGPQQFMIMQDQARNFAHNRQLTLNRQKAIADAGGFREPIENGTRSFKPAYGELHDFKSFVAGGDVQDARGNTALLKLVRPAGARSGEPKAHITFLKRAEKPTEKPFVRFQEGGSSGSGTQPGQAALAPVATLTPAAARLGFSAAQLARRDPVSRHISTYTLKTTPEQRSARKTQQDAAKALREASRNARLDRAAAKEVAKQRKQAERLFR